MRREKLSIEQQIEHMKNNGIMFSIVDELEAAEYLSKNNYYFRVKAYAKNYPKYHSGPNAGKYFGLEFAHLKELSILDMRLRSIIFGMTQDIEHYIKLHLINDIAQLKNSDEDGYSIIHEVFTEDEVKNIQKEKDRNSACSDLIEKYSQDWAIWNIVEILSFSKTVRIYSKFYEKYPDFPNISKYLFSVRYLRNATAHNNCLINSIKKSYTSTEPVRSQSIYDRLLKTELTSNKEELSTLASRGEYVITPKRLKKWMDNHVVNDFIVMVLAYCEIVSSEGVKNHRMGELYNFFCDRAVRHADYFASNENILTAYKFIKKFLDYVMKRRI